MPLLDDQLKHQSELTSRTVARFFSASCYLNNGTHVFLSDHKWKSGAKWFRRHNDKHMRNRLANCNSCFGFLTSSQHRLTWTCKVRVMCVLDACHNMPLHVHSLSLRPYIWSKVQAAARAPYHFLQCTHNGKCNMERTPRWTKKETKWHGSNFFQKALPVLWQDWKRSI